jgi:UDP-N-acetylmuramyl tripeptide synthase
LCRTDHPPLHPALHLPGRFNLGNAAMATAAAVALGAGADAVIGPIAEITTVSGRYASVRYHGRSLRLLLAKNAAGWAEVLDVMLPPPAPAVVALNARGPDGRDTSWIWDTEHDALAGRPVVAIGERRMDMAARLAAAGADFQIAPDLAAAVGMLPPGPVDVLANYTAFQQIRKEVGRV